MELEVSWLVIFCLDNVKEEPRDILEDAILVPNVVDICKIETHTWKNPFVRPSGEAVSRWVEIFERNIDLLLLEATFDLEEPLP